MVVFDELHKYDDWKNFLKGFFDLHPHLRWKILVTGSARLDAFRKGDDSLLGRYFIYRCFPYPWPNCMVGFRRKNDSRAAAIDNDEWNRCCNSADFRNPF